MFGKTFNPKMMDVAVAITVGVVVSVYKLGPLLKEITEKERMQIEQRKHKMQQNSTDSLE
jgi:mannitol-specific phosphotransferase system IIBC component